MTILTVIFFETKIRSATLATKINKNQGFVLRQLASIWLSIFVNSGLSFVLAQMNATGCISGQNKKDSFLLGFGILHAVGGVRRLRFKV